MSHARPLRSEAEPAVIDGVTVSGPRSAAVETVLMPEALAFVAGLERRFRAGRAAILEQRRETQARLDAGARPDFLAETKAVRESEWTVADAPHDLLDRRVEITGPVEAKMIINALNSGASVYMADLEDSCSPTWRNVTEGQRHLMSAVRRELRHTSPEGKEYRLAGRVATLMVRPRGWHLEERHVLVDGAPVSASLFDFGLFFFHNAREQIARGTGPYFYLPKLESHLEARLWNDVFVAAQSALGIPRGTIRATVLIETILAAFVMDEILFELKEHSAGLNCGRWDYIFSFIKKLRSDPGCVLPDRGLVTMEQHFLRSYSLLLVDTCHRRGAHAMGGMAAQIPDKDDAARNRVALEKVRADKRREVRAGHDGTWVAHPALVATAREEFDREMPGPHQIHRRSAEGAAVAAADLLRVPTGAITEAGLRQNVDVGIRYLEAWLRGSGCVPIHGLMEDAATAEISRTQLWQWIRHGASAGGEPVTAARVRAVFADELEAIRARIGDERFAAGRFATAARLLEGLVTAPELEDFLTLSAYEHILSTANHSRQSNQP